MAKVDIYFTSDLSKPQFVPHYIHKTSDTDGIYDLIDNRLDNPELAIEVSSWAELATIGEEYEHDDLHAEITDD